VCASPRMRLTTSALGLGVLVLAAWALFAALAPTVLGIDHRGLESIVKAGDHTALSTTRHPSFSSYPLKALAPIAFAAGLLALTAMRLLRNAPEARGKRRGNATAPAAVAASVLGALLCAGAATARAADRASVAKPPASSPAAICRRIRAASGPLRLPARHKRLTILVTGDSLIYPIDEELAVGRAGGMRVVADRRDGTGLTTRTVNWDRLSKQQAARVRPDVTVITLGGRDGGIPLEGLAHKLVPCCGTPWLELYADRVRPLIRAYLRGGHGRVYWLLLPAPHEALRAPLFEAVNDALRLLAPEFGASLRLIPNDAVISPGGFQDTITYDGLQIHPRTPDGIHLTHEGACVERSLVIEGLRADGLLSPPRS
jgi:hypothetical protein